jgi:hypothetical protein
MARAATVLLLGAALLGAASFSCPIALAGDVAVRAAADKTEASLDDVIVVQVSVEGTRSEPSLPDLGGAFKIQSRGTSSQMTIINGRMSSKQDYSYALYPQKAGTFTIPPFTVQDGGAAVQSNTLRITVAAAEPQQKDSGEVFVTASVDTASPYLGQQIMYTFQFCRRVKVASASLTEQPAFDGFQAESLGKEVEFQKVINGQQYLVTEIRQALFPLKTGELVITPTTLQAAVVTQGRSRRGRGTDPFFGDSFFGFTETVPRQFRTAPVTVTVRPLPEEGRPADFRNLVGQFSLTSHLSATSAKVGDSLTLTITVAGTGSLKNLQTIDLGQLDQFKIYDDKPVVEQAVVNGRIGGKVVVKKALVPLAAGALQVPAVGFSYFDTEARAYKRLTGTAYTVQVSPSAAGEKLDLLQAPGAAGSRKQEVELLGQDILPVRTAAEVLRHRQVAPPALLVLAAALAPPLLCLGLAGMRRYRERQASDPGAVRQRLAHKAFLKHLASARKAAGDEKAFYPAAAQALKAFIGDKLAIPGQALTGRDLESLLQGRVPGECIAELQQLMDSFDAGQFGFRQLGPAERQSALDRLQSVVHRLNRDLRP